MISRSSKDGRSGFSMIELLVVLGVIAVLAALAGPNLGGWVAKRQLDSATRNIAAHLHQARSRAVTSNANVRVAFNRSVETYTVWSGSDVIVPATSLPGSIDILSTTFISDSTGFDSLGLAIQNGTIRIESISTELNSNNNWREIALSAGGSIKIRP